MKDTPGGGRLPSSAHPRGGTRRFLSAPPSWRTHSITTKVRPVGSTPFPIGISCTQASPSSRGGPRHVKGPFALGLSAPCTLCEVPCGHTQRKILELNFSLTPAKGRDYAHVHPLLNHARWLSRRSRASSQLARCDALNLTETVSPLRLSSRPPDSCSADAKGWLVAFVAMLRPR